MRVRMGVKSKPDTFKAHYYVLGLDVDCQSTFLEEPRCQRYTTDCDCLEIKWYLLISNL